MAHSAPTSVVVHPIVLLSTVDHYNRVAKDTKKRVVGVLLGKSYKGKIDVLNSYAVPFEEEPNSKIWYLDHNFHETMYSMFKKVNASENIVGWYSTGPLLRKNDLEINELFKRYTPNPALVIIDVKPKELGIPTKAYISVEVVQEVNSVTTQSSQTFQQIPSEMGALEAEEVGVEHLLRDVKDTSISTLTTQVNEKMVSLRSLIASLEDTSKYIEKVVNKELPINVEVMNNLQNIFNLLPNLNLQSLVESLSVKSNDMLHVMYLSSLIRSVIALHNLIQNQSENRAHELGIEEAERKKLEEKEKDEKAKEDKKDGDKKDGEKKDGGKDTDVQMKD